MLPSGLKVYDCILTAAKCDSLVAYKSPLSLPLQLVLSPVPTRTLHSAGLISDKDRANKTSYNISQISHARAKMPPSRVLASFPLYSPAFNPLPPPHGGCGSYSHSLPQKSGAELQNQPLGCCRTQRALSRTKIKTTCMCPSFPRLLSSSEQPLGQGFSAWHRENCLSQQQAALSHVALSCSSLTPCSSGWQPCGWSCCQGQHRHRLHGTLRGDSEGRQGGSWPGRDTTSHSSAPSVPTPLIHTFTPSLGNFTARIHPRLQNQNFHKNNFVALLVVEMAFQTQSSQCSDICLSLQQA